MTNLQVSIAQYNGEGACVSLENYEGDSLMIHITPWDKDPALCCKEAADVLREAIHRLEKLATMKKPFHAATHRKLNGR